MRPGSSTSEYRVTVGAFIAAGAAILAETVGVEVPQSTLELVTHAAFAAAVVYPLARGLAKGGGSAGEAKPAVESSEFRVAVVGVVGGALAMLCRGLPDELRESISQGVAATVCAYIASRGLAKRPAPPPATPVTPATPAPPAPGDSP